MGVYKEGLKEVIQQLYPYFSLLNLYLLFTYAFRDTVYTFGETIRYHFLFYYVLFLLPLALSIFVGKRLLYTEYPKLAYLVMPIVGIIPFAIFSPSRCSAFSCTQGAWWVLFLAVIVLSIRKSYYLNKEHGEYMEFASQKKVKKIYKVVFTLFNIMAFAAIPFLNNVHAQNDDIIANLTTMSPEMLLEECGEIRFSFGKKALCLNQVALNSNDVSICRKIRLMIFENEDADRCYRNLAVLNDDIELCNKAMFKDMRYDCYNDFSPLTDVLCGKITDEDYRIGCLSDCSSVDDVVSRDSCYFSKASYNTTVDLCQHIDDVTMQTSCYDTILPIFTDCSSLVADDYRDSCYVSIARDQKDASLCSEISKVSSKEKCITSVSQSKEDCAGIESPRVREVCEAGHSSTEEECKAYTLSLSKDACYIAVAKAQDERALCAKIDDINKKTICENYFG